MTATALSILIVIAVGALFGTIIGLVLGFITGNQRPEWSAMSPREKKINVVLVVVFSVICIAGLAWYFLV